MAKKVFRRKNNNAYNLSTKRFINLNRFEEGGAIPDSLDKISNIGSVLGGATSILDSAMKNSQIADTSNIESIINNANNINVSEGNTFDSLTSLYDNFSFLNNEISYDDIRGISDGQIVGNTINAIGSGALSGASVGGPWGAAIGAVAGGAASLIGASAGNNEANYQVAVLNQKRKQALNRANLAIGNQASNIRTNNFNNALANISAYGGTINIKKKNRGKFTASADKAGMGVQEFARHVLSNKDKYSTTMIKRANFARNAVGWKHGEGGNLFVDIPDYQTHGGNFLNGVTFINEGGTHEQNPLEGVPVGVAPDGQPNLVEEGEVIFNDYVFSNRLSLSDKELEAAKLPRKYKGYTFALAAEDMSKESSERPNDPISKKGLEDSMMKLAMIQEQQRMEKGKKGTQQMMAFGGRKYDGTENIDTSYNFFVPYMNKKGKAKNKGVWVDSRGNMEGSSKINPYDKENTLPTYLRYAPVLGSAIGSISSIFSKPDYENSDFLLDYADSLSYNPVKFRPVSNYLTYKPLDKNYYLSQLKSQAGATRRAITNSGGNAGTVMAGLIAADSNAQRAVGDTLMKMDMYNEQQRQAVEQFNRGTNQINSQGFMSADNANLQARLAKDKLRLSAIDKAAQMREIADTTLEQSRSMNLTNFFDNLGGIGKENMAWNWRDALIDSGAFGIGADRITKASKGGLLTKRNRRRK